MMQGSRGDCTQIFAALLQIFSPSRLVLSFCGAFCMTRTTADRERALATDFPLAPASGLRQVALVIQAMRPREWSKNLLLFAGVFFAGHLFQPAALLRAVIAAVAFCAASGAIYIFNDLLDIRRDRLHPTKRLRPLASGALSKPAAISGMISATLVAFALAGMLARL